MRYFYVFFVGIFILFFNFNSYGARYYWVNGAGNWSDMTHWSNTSGGAPFYATMPSPTDSVFFDANSGLLTNDTVFVDSNAVIYRMDWSGILTSPVLKLDTHLTITKTAVLHPNVTVFSDFINGGNFKIESDTNTVFDPQQADFQAPFIYQANDISDTLQLISRFYQSNNPSYLVEGTFISLTDTIKSLSIILTTDSLKNIDLNTTYLLLTNGWSAQNVLPSTLTIDADSAIFNISGSYGSDYFHGNGYYYHIVEISSLADTTLLTGSNTFDQLIFHPGLRIALEAGITQTVNDSLVIQARCPDSVFVFSDTPGTRAVITTTNTVSEVVNYQDIRYTSPITTYFSTNLGNNLNITFDATPSATASFTLPYQICINTPVNFNNSSTAFSGNFSDLSFMWTFGVVDTINDDTVYVATPTYTYTQTGQFYVTLTATYNYNNCSHQLIDSINVNDPTTDIYTSDIDTTICQGDDIGFSATYGLSNYDFYINNTLAQSSSSYTFNTTQLTNNDSVWVITDQNGCRDTSIAIPVQVLALPVINETLSSSSDTLCSADTLTVSVSGADMYQFYYNNNNTTGGFNANNSNTYTNINTNDTIYIIGLDSVTQCQDTSGIHIFTVYQNPTVTLQNLTGSNIICANDTFNVKASGASNYQFYINQTAATSLTPDSLFSVSTLNSGDTIRVTGEMNNCFAAGTPDIIVTVNPLPNINVTANDSDLIICAGDNLSFSATGASTYTFYVNGAAVQGPSGSNSYSSNGFSSGDVILVEGSLNGCQSVSTGDTVTVIPLPTVSFTSSDADTTICLNDTVTFTASGADNYQYIINGVPVGTLSGNPLYITDSLQNNQVITLIGEQNGCQNTAINQYTFTVKPVPQISFYTSDSVICFGENITFTATGGDSYEFFVNNISQAPPAPGGTYTTNSLSSGIQNISVIGYLNGCGSAGDTSFSVNVLALPNVLLNISSDTICENDSIVFTAQNAQNYQFYVNGIAQAPYSADSVFIGINLQNNDTVSVAGIANGCSNAGDTSYVVTVNPLPVLTFGSSDADNVICAGDTVSFTATGAGNYYFYIDSILVAANTAGVYTTDSLQNGQTVTLSGITNGCSATSNAAFTFTVNPLPSVILTANDTDLIICEGDWVTFTASGANLYQFYLNGNTLNTFGTNNTYLTDSLTNGTQISVVGMSNYGCQSPANDTLSVTVIPKPSVVFSSSDADGLLCQGDSVTFTASGATGYLFLSGNDTLLGFSPVNTLTIDSLTNSSTISVVGEQNGCQAAGDTSFTFTVYAYPITYLTTNDSIDNLCVGDTATFIAGGALTYEFFVNGISQGVSANNILSGVFNANDTIRVTGYNNICPTASDTEFVVTVFTYPVITTQINPNSFNICYDDTITVSANGANEYAFFLNQFMLQNTSPLNSINLWHLENTDTVKVIGYNGKCASQVQSLNFSITKLNLQLTANPKYGICNGETVTLTASGANQYQFFANNNAVTGVSPANTYTATPSTNSVYSVTGYASGCAQTSSPVYIDVYDTPQISPAGPVKICNGDSVILQSNAPYGNQWYNTQGIIFNASDSVYQANATNDYYVNFEPGGNGVVLSLGNNSNGQFGDSSTIGSRYPVKALSIDNAQQLYTGEHHSLALKSNGTVWVWGDNSYGQIGTGNFTDQWVPYPIPSLSGVQRIGCGNNHSLAYDGTTLYGWGDNTYGELGLGSNGIANFPTAIPFNQPVSAISGGKNYTLILDNSGNVWSSGKNDFGQLAQGNTVNLSSFTLISGLSNIVKISAGNGHALALDNNGNIWVWGNNANGQLGLNNIAFSTVPVKLQGLPEIIDISAGADHSVLLDSKGHLLTFGNNQYGQLGNGNFNNSITPIHLTGHQFTAVYAGYYNTFALKADSSVWAFGKNQFGQINGNTSLPVTIPSRIAFYNGSKTVSSGLYYSTSISNNTHTCSSNIVQVSIDTTPNVIIVTNGDTLYTPTSGISYQWYLNNNPIPGATGNSFVPTTSGLYTVEVNFSNGCSATSSEYYLPPAGIPDFSRKNLFSIYPNPTTGKLFIQSATRQKHIQVILYDLSGKIIFKYYFELFRADNTSTLSLPELSEGIYFIEIQSENNIQKIKIAVLNE